MTLPVSGAISFNAINVELGQPGTTTANINQASYRTLAGVPGSGTTISLSNFYGKSNVFSFSFSGGTDVNLRTAAVSAGWNQSTAVIATNNGTIQSSSTGTPALTINGSWPGGVSFINNALIVGRGGNGGAGGNVTTSLAGTNPGSPGSGAGLALSVSAAVSITNNSTIAGGGGGGGGGGGAINRSGGKGGGGGGGIGVSTGGPAGTGGPGTAGTAGTPGTTGGAGPGGAGGRYPTAPYGGPGGTGGGYGSTGSPGINGIYLPSGVATGGSGGAAGACTSGNANITWVATGTRIGALN